MSGAGVVLGFLGLGLWLFAVIGRGLVALVGLYGFHRRPRRGRGRDLF